MPLNQNVSAHSASLHHPMRLVREFLLMAHSAQIPPLDAYVAEQVKCWGFPEFNPANRDEYQGFFYYIADVFAEQEFSIEQMLVDDAQVQVRFRIKGKHHEEFMGLPATGGTLEFSATALFRLTAGLIGEVWMYNKNIVLQTTKGYGYSTCTTPAQPQVCDRRALAC